MQLKTQRHLIPTRFAPTLIAALVLLLLAGCTRIQLAYNTADFFIERYVDDYLTLDSVQLASWRPTLVAALSRHRSEELPYLAAFFDTAWRDVRGGFTETKMACLLDQFEDLYRRHSRLAVELAAPLLAAATPEQIRNLQRKFRADAEETARDVRTTERKAQKRAQRYAKSAEWWIGPLTDEQRRIVTEVTAGIPDTAGLWAAYRQDKQAELIRMLQRGADEAAVRQFLVDWLVEYRDLPPALRQIREGVRAGIGELWLRIDASLSPGQRDHFAGRLKTLRDDFMSLQRRPRMAMAQCT